MSLKQPPEPTPEAPLNPAAVPVEQLARMLGLPMDHLRQHVAQGAPTNASGTINLVHYAAWLNRDTGQCDAPSGAGGGGE
jgi:hypothetical protein